MKGREIGGRGGDEDVGEALVLGFSVVFAVLHVHSGNGGKPTVVEEIFSVMGDRWVTRFEEGVADGVTENEAFSIDGLHGDGDVGREDGKNDMGEDGFNVGKDGGDGPWQDC